MLLITSLSKERDHLSRAEADCVLLSFQLLDDSLSPFKTPNPELQLVKGTVL